MEGNWMNSQGTGGASDVSRDNDIRWLLSVLPTPASWAGGKVKEVPSSGWRAGRFGREKPAVSVRGGGGVLDSVAAVVRGSPGITQQDRRGLDRKRKSSVC